MFTLRLRELVDGCGVGTFTRRIGLHSILFSIFERVLIFLFVGTI